MKGCCYIPKRSLSLSRSLLDASKFGRLDVITVLLQSVMVGEISFSDSVALLLYDPPPRRIRRRHPHAILKLTHYRVFSYERASGYLIFFSKKNLDAHC